MNLAELKGLVAAAESETLEYRQNGNKSSIWEKKSGALYTTIQSPQSPERLESSTGLEQQVLIPLFSGPLSKSKIAAHLGHESISGGVKKTLQAILQAGLIALTIPQKPNSRLQKY